VGDIVIVAPWVIAMFATMVLAAGLWSWRWRRSTPVRRVLASLTALVTVVLTVAASVNAHYAYLPRLRDAADLVWPGLSYTTVSTRVLQPGRHEVHPGGGVLRLSLPDGHDGLGPSSALLYLPPQYFLDPAASFPVVYLLHGSPGSSEDWFRAGDAEAIGRWLARRGQPSVLVAPRLSRSWLDDSECVDGRREAVETHLLRTVLTSVELAVRVRSDRAGRVLVGNSAGGFCALNIGLRHRDAFGTVISLSGETHPTYTGGLQALFGRRNLSARIRSNSPDLYAAELPPGPPTRLWLDSGRADLVPLGQLTRLSRLLRGRSDLQARLVLRPGGHDYGVWRPGLRAALGWAVPPSATDPRRRLALSLRRQRISPAAAAAARSSQDVPVVGPSE
jgi:enterochelin esterase-like enzyme